MRTFTRNRRNVSNLNYHIITCPKFRKPYLLKNKKQLLSCFKKSCIMHKCIIKEIEIMPDHVHIFINVLKPYKFKLTRFIHHLKGYSSFFIRKNKPWMKKYKAFFGLHRILWSQQVIYHQTLFGNILEIKQST